MKDRQGHPVKPSTADYRRVNASVTDLSLSAQRQTLGILGNHWEIRRQGYFGDSKYQELKPNLPTICHGHILYIPGNYTQRNRSVTCRQLTYQVPVGACRYLLSIRYFYQLSLLAVCFVAPELSGQGKEPIHCFVLELITSLWHSKSPG